MSGTAKQGPPAPRISGRRIAVGVAGLLAVTALVIAVIVPRSGDVGEALNRAGAGDFALIVLLGVASQTFRTGAWQVAIDSAGGRVRGREAHPACGVSYVIALLSPYLGIAARVAVIRRLAPDRSPAVPAQVAAESALLIVEGALVGVLIVCAYWTLEIPFILALVIFVGGMLGAAALVHASRRFSERTFGPGLRVAGDPRSLALLTVTLAGALSVQIVRVWVTLSSVGIHAPPAVIVAVFLATGLGAVLPIGTAAAGAAAPLVAASAGSAADAAAAGVMLSSGLAVSSLTYLLVAASASGLLVAVARRPGPENAR